jgi:hypothetical protein
VTEAELPSDLVDRLIEDFPRIPRSVVEVLVRNGWERTVGIVDLATRVALVERQVRLILRERDDR